MSINEISFTKDNLNNYLKEISKEYRKQNGRTMPVEIILVGGAAVLANYDFRDMTTDVDAIIASYVSLKDIINKVGNKYNLPYRWLNDDFIKSDSYSSKLMEVSQYYRTFSNIVTIRTISAEYLIAMKLRSGREYKKDLSDIAGILDEHKKLNTPILMKDIDKAVKRLYGSWDNIPLNSVDFLKKIFDKDNLTVEYKKIREEEQKLNNQLLHFTEDYPNVLNKDNMSDIIKSLKKQKLNNELEEKNLNKTKSTSLAEKFEKMQVENPTAFSTKEKEKNKSKNKNLIK